MNLSKFQKDDVVTRIIASYVSDSIELTKEEESMRIRLIKTWNLLVNYHSREQALSVLKKEYNLSDAQAYRTINSAMRLFGNVFKNEKEAHRFLLFEYNQKLLQKAIKERNLEVEDKALSRMERLLPADSDLAFNPEKLQNNPIEIKIPRELKKMFAKMIANGVVDFNNQFTEAEIVDE